MALMMVAMGLHMLANGPLAYGYFRDELYYLACAEHLDWGYVDHPPLSIGLLWLSRAVFGDSLQMLRLVPTMAGATAVMLAGMIARELGGGRTAQAIAALAALVAPAYLAIGGIYSMNAVDLVLWCVATWLVLRLVNGGEPRLWIALGVVLGLGLLNKISMLWFGLGLLAGLALTPQRRWLLTPWPWLATAIALALFAPHVWWQVQHDWPTVEFVRNATRAKMTPTPPGAFLAGQALAMHPLCAPLWIAGLLYFFVTKTGKPYRVVAWIWVTVALLLLVSGTARAYYLTPAYPALLAGGGIVVERLARPAGRTWIVAGVAAALGLGGIVTAPAAIPLLPVDTYIAYARTVGLAPPREENTAIGPLPQHFADMFGWPELVNTVAEVYAALPEADRARAGIYVDNYGEAGALDFFGDAHGLPGAIAAHNSYWLWGPGESTGAVMLALAESAAPLRDVFEEVTRAAPVACPYCMPHERAKAVYVCRGLKEPLSTLWPRLKRYR